MRIDPQTAIVHVDGARINVRDDLVYLALNKPRGVLSAMSDDRGRPTVGDLVADRPERLFHVGRLDADSEGLLLLTNDGDLAHRLMHPSFGVSKTYLATVPAPVGRDVGRRLRAGVDLEDGPVRGGRVPRGADLGRTRDRRGRAARGPQAHRAPAARRASATRSSAWSAPRSGRCGSAVSAPGTVRALTPRRARRAASISRRHRPDDDLTEEQPWRFGRSGRDPDRRRRSRADPGRRVELVREMLRRNELTTTT